MKFNKNIKNNNVVLNRENHKAYTITIQEELLNFVTTTFIEGGFYATKEEQLKNLKELIKKCFISDPYFVIGLTNLVRTEFNMRSVSHVMIGELSKMMKGEIFKTKDFIKDTIVRVDDMTEILGYLLDGNKNRKQRKGILTHSIVKAFNETINEGKFDEYQFGKYKRSGKTKINLKDLVRLSHSKGELSEKILFDTLKTPFTWEVELSKIPKTDYNQKIELWNKLLNENRFPYMALIRSLVKIVRDLSSSDFSEYTQNQKLEVVNNVSKIIKNEKFIEKSKLFPFNFLIAYKTLLKYTNEEPNSSIYATPLIIALKEAASYSIKNITLEGTVAAFADVSGSMHSFLSEKSKIQHIDIALMFTSMLKMINPNSVAGIFGDTAKLKNLEGTSVFELNSKYNQNEVGLSTNGEASIRLLIENKIKVDKIFLFTDEEMNSGSIQNAFAEYKKIYGKTELYSINLNSSKTRIANQDGFFRITGWSDKIFQYIDFYDKNKKDSTIEDIRKFGLKYKR